MGVDSAWIVDDSLSEPPDKDAAEREEKNEIFDVLRNERRRYVLEYLDSTADETAIGELSEALAEYESDDGSYDHRDRKRMYVSLYQNHLPMMTDAGIIDYDTRSGTIQLTPSFQRVRPYLYGQPSDSVRWHRAYLAAGMVGLGAVILGSQWVSALSSIPDSVWLGSLVGFYGLLVAAHTLVVVE